MIVHEFIKAPLFKLHMALVIVDNPKELSDFLGEHGDEEGARLFGEDDEIYAHTVKGCLNKKDKDYAVDCLYVIFNGNHTSKLTHGVIAHESLHVMGTIMARSGWHFDFSNDEPQAYLIEWLVNTITDFLIKNKINIHTDEGI